MDATSALPKLHCLAGNDAPPGLAADLRRVLDLPVAARETLWQVLGPSLAEPIPKETEELLDLFCAAHTLDDDDVARPLKALRFLVREGACLDLPAAALAEDLDRLCPGEPQIKELLLSGYEPARAQLRHDILRSALSDHGKLLVRAQWRVDTIQASERGKQLRAPVALLTLHYREGAEAGRITLQVLPDMMAELRGVCEQVLG